jgi:two-component system, OmpR family, phosphate regulon response regulator OmpR
MLGFASEGAMAGEKPTRPAGKIESTDTAARTGAEAPAQPHVIVVDDDETVRDVLEEFLAQRGFTVSTADGGAALRHVLAERPADAVLLDLNMPGEDGLTLVRYLRANTSAAVLMVTSAAEVVDRVVGLELGADDYIAKPFDLREVAARIRSVLRRNAPTRAASAAPAAAQRRQPAEPQPEEIRFGRYILNLSSRLLRAEDGTDVMLTSMEFDVLKVLGMHPNKTLNRQRILELAHGRDWDPLDRSLDIRITRLRQKIEAVPSRPRLIRTVRGVGYVFVPDDKPADGK